MDSEPFVFDCCGGDLNLEHLKLILKALDDNGCILITNCLGADLLRIGAELDRLITKS